MTCEVPVRCQTNTLLKSQGKREVNFFYHSSTLKEGHLIDEICSLIFQTHLTC